MSRADRWLAVAALASVAAAKWTLGNHGISSSFCNLSDATVNPASFGDYITPSGVGRLAFAIDSQSGLSFNDVFGGAPGEAVFPSCRLGPTSRGPAGALWLHWNAFAPLSPSSSIQGFLPFITAQLDVLNNDAVAHTIGVSYSFTCMDPFCSASSRSGAFATNSSVAVFNGSAWVGFAGPAGSGVGCPAGAAGPSGLCVAGNVTVPPGGRQRLTVYVGAYQATGRYAAAYPTLEALFSMAVLEQDALAAAHAAFLDGAWALGGGPASGIVLREYREAACRLCS
jgi:hypothetical protein